MDPLSPPTGLTLPLITPFRDGRVDETSLRRLTRHYLAEPIDAFVIAGTTGEAMALDDGELARMLDIVAEVVSDGDAARPCPSVYLGVSGGATRMVARALRRADAWPVDGYLITCPHVIRPSQAGLYEHFRALAADTDRPIILYNIPYRTGVDMSVETTLRLAEIPNIVGLKECSADPTRVLDIINARPDGFSVLSGEDAHYLAALSQGADGGILASAHVAPRAFAAIRAAVLAGDGAGALAAWRELVAIPRALFAEPNPGPIKHWLWRVGLIDSPEQRAPLAPISDGLADRIDRLAGVALAA